MVIFRTIAKISQFYCWDILIWATLYITMLFCNVKEIVHRFLVTKTLQKTTTVTNMTRTDCQQYTAEKFSGLYLYWILDQPVWQNTSKSLCDRSSHNLQSHKDLLTENTERKSTKSNSHRVSTFSVVRVAISKHAHSYSINSQDYVWYGEKTGNKWNNM